MGDSVALKIDGNEVKALFGQTIFEAARAAGIEIPHLCYHRQAACNRRLPHVRRRGGESWPEAA